MNEIYFGAKVYHYMYGAMTVIKIDGKNFCTTVDSPTGIVPGTSAANTWSDEHWWYLDCVGSVVFTNAKDVVNFAAQYPGVEPYDPNVLNLQFRP